MKYLICLGLSLGLVEAAAAQDRSGRHMGFSVGSFSYEEDADVFGERIDDSTSTYRLMGGYRFSDRFALEGGWVRRATSKKASRRISLHSAH